MRAMRTCAKKKECANAPIGPFTTFSHRVYVYNIRNELVSATKNAEDTEYQYQYDNTGNHITSFDLGTNRTYTANNLNQYTLVGRVVPNAPQEEFVPHFDDGSQALVKTATGIWSITYSLFCLENYIFHDLLFYRFYYCLF